MSAALTPTPTDTTASAPALVVEGTPAPETAAAPQTNDPMAGKFAILAKREKAIRQSQRALEAREATLKAKEAAFTKPENAQVDWKRMLATDPARAFMEAGLTGDQLTQAILQHSQTSPESVKISTLEAKIQKLEDLLGKSQETAQDNQNQGREQVRRQYKHDLERLIAADESYETLAASGDTAKDAVVSLIEETFNEDGYVMPIEEAAQAVEEHLVEQALALAKLKKIQAKLAPAPATDTPETAPQKTTPTQQTVGNGTLSNRMTQTASIPASKAQRDRIRRDRAILAAQGKLN